MNKIGRNDKCPCNSGLKYKKCCANKCIESKYTLGQENSSQKIISIIDKLQKRYPNYRFINITNDLHEDNYREYQIKNFNTNIVMVADFYLLCPPPDKVIPLNQEYHNV